MTPVRKALLFFALSAICLTVQFGVMMHLTALPDYRLHTLLVAVVPEVLLLLLPYWLITPRFRPWVLVPAGVSAVWFLANILYFRSYADFLPVASLSMTGNAGKLLFDSALHSFEPIDSVIIASFIILTAAYLILRRDITRKCAAFSRRTRLSAISLTLLVAIVWQGFLFWRDRRSGVTPTEHLTETVRTSRLGQARSYGYTHYILLDIANALTSSEIELTDEQRAMIDEFIRRQRNTTAGRCRIESPNLILIIVESLNSDAISSLTTPTLTQLIADSTTLSALRTMPEVGPGRSSDGQFIYNTGLLPLSDEVTVQTYGNAPYPSLAKALGYRVAEEVIGESASMWNHATTSRSYGYGKIHDIRELPPYQLNEADSLIFNHALSIIDTISTPFFLEITTLSSHQPYLKESYPEGEIRRIYGDNPTSYYLESVNYFDRQLGRFISALQQRGILQHSVVAIAADHNAPISLTDGETARHIPMIILNAPQGGMVKQTIGQSALFPALLRATGATRYFWQGLSGASDDEAAEISRLIIKGRYFR